MAKTKTLDFRVANLELAGQGRDQIRLAEQEMPGMMALREEFRASQPLKGARITGSLHMTIQTAVLIETLVMLGAKVRWASCNIFSTQDEAAAAVVVGAGTPENPKGSPVFAWKGESLKDYWWCTERIFDWSDEGADGPNMILDDGGDATMFVHLGVKFEKLGVSPEILDDDPEEKKIMLALLAEILASEPGKFSKLLSGIKGVTEETTTGVRRLQNLFSDNQLLFPAINVNDAATKSKFDNRYGVRHSLIDGLNRATDTLLGGKVSFVCGYGDVGKGAAESLRGQGSRVIVSEVDPILALQAAMDGYQVTRLESVVDQVDVLITATGNVGVVSASHLLSLKNQAIVANVGHFDNELDLEALGKHPGVSKREIKPNVHEWLLPGGKTILVLSEGRLMNLGNATGHPSFVMSTSFANQVLAQIEIFSKTDKYPLGVHLLPKKLDEKVARLHLDALGVQLTELSQEQAEYIGVDRTGPFKVDYYRY